MRAEAVERDFSHPYQPYDIQKDFMKAVYTCLEEGKVGIFESPTGTGKTLSLICGSLTWLREHKKSVYENEDSPNQPENDEPDWMLEHVRRQQKEGVANRLRKLNERIANIRAKERRIREGRDHSEPATKRQKLSTNATNRDYNEDEFVLDDYDSDGETRTGNKAGAFNETGLSSETKALMRQLGYLDESSDLAEASELDETRIFFCSRTHSQLTQFSSELRRVRMPAVIAVDEASEGSSEAPLIEHVKHLTLGSRKNLCINSKVSCLGNATAINERCVELQQSHDVRSRCQYLPNKENEGLVLDFRDHALAKIRDIEELGVLGKKLGVCPYYASRSAAQYCEIITLPYPLLLQKSARDALGISLKSHVVIIDEAHNLMDAITGISSISVSLEQVRLARTQLTEYLQRFRNKLKGKNRVYVAQTIRLLDSIATYLQSINEGNKPIDGLADMVSIMSGKGVDQIDVFKLNTYLQQSRLARKVDGFTALRESLSGTKPSQYRQQAQDRSPRQNVPVLMHIQSFLSCLMNPSAEGRFFYAKDDPSSATLRYMLLDPTFHFKDIVEEARAVILAGGTMSPMSDYKQHLLSYLDQSNIMTLSCGHVIPPTNLLAMTISKSPQKFDLDFTYENRSKTKTILDLGATISSFARRIPDGLVVFFPSYAYLDLCISTWKQSQAVGTTGTTWDDFTQAKQVFLEQRNQQSASEVSGNTTKGPDSVLAAYSAAVASGDGNGALLFAVVGGSLSEGINFSDALGRGVIVVGLPFPNPHSAEWKAKMQYISSKESQAGGNGSAAATEFFENSCMRAVNQCIGRAIRHKGDYAAILLLDRRYASKRIQSKLPGWIGSSLQSPGAWNDVEQSLGSFFTGRGN